MANIAAENVDYTAGATTLRGYLAVDSQHSGPRPAVIVVHEWWGLNDYIRGRARQLAELGYVALAVDMYGEGRTADDPGGASALMMAVLGDIKLGEERFAAALDLLRARADVTPDRIAAIGYCFGGAMVLHAARKGVPLRAVVSFHGSLGSFHKPLPGDVKARVLVCHGAGDTLVPTADLAAFEAEMSAARADYRVESYPDVLHGFTNPEATGKGARYGVPLAYDAAADARSWASMRALLEEVFA